MSNYIEVTYWLNNQVCQNTFQANTAEDAVNKVHHNCGKQDYVQIVSVKAVEL